MFFSSEIASSAPVTFGRSYPVAKGYICVVTDSKLFIPDGEDDPTAIVLSVNIAEGELAGCWAGREKRIYINLTGETPWGDSNADKAKKTLTTIINDNEGIFEKNEDIFSVSFDEQRLIGCTVGVAFKWDVNNPKFVKPSYICSKDYAEKIKEKDKPAPKTDAEQFDVPREGDEPAPKKPLFGKR
jgi:hypothetical protein